MGAVLDSNSRTLLLATVLIQGSALSRKGVGLGSVLQEGNVRQLQAPNSISYI